MKDIWLNKNIVISVCDSPDQQLEVNGRIWRFDYDSWFGPLWLKKNGEPRECQNPNKAVWQAFEEWSRKNTL
jgi:hypothetical protein